jgi:hypothetical protein
VAVIVLLRLQQQIKFQSRSEKRENGKKQKYPQVKYDTSHLLRAVCARHSFDGFRGNSQVTAR